MADAETLCDECDGEFWHHVGCSRLEPALFVSACPCDACEDSRRGGWSCVCGGTGEMATEFGTVRPCAMCEPFKYAEWKAKVSK